MLMEAGRKMETSTEMTGLALQDRDGGGEPMLSSSSQNQTGTTRAAQIPGLQPAFN